VVENIACAQERVLLQAKYFEKEDVRSIAERLSISPKVVESRLTRELRLLLDEALQNQQREA
jgi:hypothetical protein